MIIKKIKLENIRSYEKAEVVFPDGSLVLAGDIGSGKTSVLLAIEFALFGLQPRQRGSSLLRTDKKEGSVELELEIDNNKVIITRSLKKSKTISQGKPFIEINNIKEEMSVEELTNKVLALLNYPREFAKKTNLLYRFTVYTPQEEMKQIILENPEVRLDTLRHIFGIDKYRRIKENTATLAFKLRETIRGYEGQIKDLEDLKKKLQEKKILIVNIEEKIKILNKELEERTKEKNQAGKELKEIEDKINEKEKYEKEADKTRIMLLSKKEIILNIEREKAALLKQMEDLKKISFEPEKIPQIESEIKANEKIEEEKRSIYLDLANRIHFLNSKILETEKLKSQISSLKLCPTCFQEVDEDYKKNILRNFNNELEKIKKELLNMNPERVKEAGELENLKQKILLLKNQLEEKKLIKIRLETINEKEIKKQELEKQKALTEKDMKFLEQQIENLKEASFLLKKYDNLYELKKKELLALEKKEKEKEIELAENKKEKEMILKAIEEIEKEIFDKEEIKKKFLNLNELEDWLSNSFLNLISFTERNIMLKLKDEFSKLFNEWFNVLVPEIFSVHLDEDFTPIIEQKDYQLEYSFLSGGERTSIALAYRLALNKVINSLMSRIKTKDLIILDEPTDGFSEQQLDKMRDVLNELKARQLIIVSHESKIESFVENIIKFRKENGVTRVES